MKDLNDDPIKWSNLEPIQELGETANSGNPNGLEDTHYHLSNLGDEDSMVEDLKYSGEKFNKAIESLREVLHAIDI